jgi:hypothetical protein
VCEPQTKRPATSVAGLLNFREVLGDGREQKETLGIAKISHKQRLNNRNKQACSAVFGLGLFNRGLLARGTAVK